MVEFCDLPFEIIVHIISFLSWKDRIIFTAVLNKVRQYMFTHNPTYKNILTNLGFVNEDYVLTILSSRYAVSVDHPALSSQIVRNHMKHLLFEHGRNVVIYLMLASRYHRTDWADCINKAYPQIN